MRITQTARRIQRRRSARSEEGFALPMALLTVVLLSTVVTGLLGYAFTATKSAVANRVTTERLYAIHAGLDTAIQQIKDGSTLCADNRTLSLTMKEGTGGPDRQVDVTCTTAGAAGTGGTVGPGGWSVFARTGITASGPLNITDGISGAVYNGGNWGLAAPKLGIKAGIVTSGGACTATPPTGLIATPKTIDKVYTCLSTQTPPRAPLNTPDIKAAGITAASTLPPAGGSQNVAGCQVFNPGYYNNPSQLVLGTYNYFKSGVYYLEDVGTWAVSKWVTAGRPVLVKDGKVDPAGTADDKRLTTFEVSASPCAGPEAADTQNGALFILGGTSAIQVLNQGGNAGRFEVYGYADLTDLSKPRVSIRTAHAAGDPAWMKQSGPAGPILSNVQGTVGTVPELAIHGVVDVWNNSVSLQAYAGGIVRLAGGVLASSLNLVSSNVASDPTTFGISTDAGRGSNRVNLVAKSISNNGGRPMEGYATVLLYGDPIRTISIDSWRIGADTTP